MATGPVPEVDLADGLADATGLGAHVLAPTPGIHTTPGHGQDLTPGRTHETGQFPVQPGKMFN